LCNSNYGKKKYYGKLFTQHFLGQPVKIRALAVRLTAFGQITSVEALKLSNEMQKISQIQQSLKDYFQKEIVRLLCML